MWSRSFRPAYLRYSMEAFGRAPARDDEGDDDVHDCGGNCGQPCCTGEPAAAGPHSKLPRTSGDVTPPGVPCRGGAWRLPNGQCPEDTNPDMDLSGGGGGGAPDPGGGFSNVPPGWDTMNPDQRMAWAREWAVQQRMSASEARAFAERAAAADRALLGGIITQGVGIVRTWVSESNQTRRAQIEADARVEIARIQARAMGQGQLPGQPGYVPPGGYPPGYQPYQPPYQPPASGGGVTEAILPLGLLFMLLKGGL